MLNVDLLDVKLVYVFLLLICQFKATLINNWNYVYTSIIFNMYLEFLIKVLYYITYKHVDVPLEYARKLVINTVKTTQE